MRNRNRRDTWARWSVEAAILIAVLAVGALFARTTHESGSRPPLPHVLGDRALAPAPGGVALEQTVTVERPAGDFAVDVSPADAAGHFDVSITDTRADDPGWQVHMTVTDAEGHIQRWTATSIQSTASFTDASGTRYEQRVARGRQDVLASAPAGHGLGIAHIEAITDSAATGPLHVTVTNA